MFVQSFVCSAQIISTLDSQRKFQMFTLFSGRIQHGGSLFAQIISTNIWSLGELRDLNSEINQNKLNWPNYFKLQKRRQYTRSTKIQRNVQGVRNIVNYDNKGTLQVRCPKGECWARTCQNADMACDCWLLHRVNTKSLSLDILKWLYLY